jgi:rhamnulokinase
VRIPDRSTAAGGTDGWARLVSTQARGRPVFAAVDLGAESGRVIVGDLHHDRLTLAEVHRFSNGPVRLGEGLRWDVLRLWSEICSGLERAAHATDGVIRGIAVDSWGVDFALLDRNGGLLGNPAHYRDDRTLGMVEVATALVSPERLFSTTGARTMRINTLFQLLSLARSDSPQLAAADRLVMIPDLLGLWLSGRAATELSIASTSQCLDVRHRVWAWPLLEELGIRTGIFGDLVAAGTMLGPLVGPLSRVDTLSRASVIAAASHDTASAAAAVPGAGPDVAWISSGTWSIIGVAAPEPLVTDLSMAYGLSNEISADGDVLVCQTMPGLWLVQECRRTWASAGQSNSYAELTQLAAGAPPFRSFVDPEDESLAEPCDMPEHIRALCRRTGQPEPVTPAQILRCVFESLALQYRRAMDRLEHVSGRRFSPVHIVGGGSRNELLCQMTADALGRPCLAGPSEATAAGNVLIQAAAVGALGSLDEGRDLLRRSFAVRAYEPRSASDWEEPYSRFMELTDDHA